MQEQKACWIKTENLRLQCSVCGSKYMNSGLCEVMRKGESVYDYEEPRYWPRCGARMESEDNA